MSVPYCGEPEKVLHSGRLRPYSHTLNSAGNSARSKHSNLLRTLVNYGL